MTLRTAITATAIAATALAISACEVNFSTDGPVIMSGDLAGEVTTEARNLEGFSEIDMRGSATLVVTQTDDFSVEVTADSALQEHISTNVDGDTLSVAQDYSVIGSSAGVTVDITVPDLTRLELSGDTKAIVRSVSTDRLEVVIDGAGDMDLAADAQVLTISVSGAGNITAHGTVKTGSITISGVGDVNAEDLTIGDANVEISGAGSINVRVRDSLDAKISGAGNIVYFGSPDVTKDVSGAGSISQG
jgi:hypothetical protein